MMAVLVPFEGGCMAREHYWPTGSKTAQDQEKRALAAEHDRQVRNRSVANDIRLDLPVSVARPDGEEHPARARFRSHDKRYEIQKPYIQGPPNVTVLDCLERTVTQPSSSSRSGGSKSTSKSSSSHWGLSWSRSNKSPPSRESRTRGQQRHPHPSNPSTSVRQQNAPSSSSCETARNSGGVAQGLLAGPSLFSTLSSSSNSSSSSSSSSSSLGGGNPNSSLLGFHRAATSLVAGDNVHSAFPLHHHHHPSTLSHHEPPPTNSTNPARCKQQQQPLSYPGGGSIAEKFSEKVQHCTNALVGSARTSPNNNNSSSASTSTAGVLSRLIDPDSKLFRSSSKDSKRSRSRSSRSGPSSSSNPVVRMDAYCSGADPGANITDSDRGELFDEGEEKKAAQQVAHRYNMMPGSKSNNHEGESMESSGGGVHNLHHHHHHHPHHPGTSPSVFSDCENGNARVPPVATIGQCGVVRDSNDSTLKLSPSSSPGQVADEYDMIPRDEEMKGGCSTDPNYSTFAKVNNNNVTSTSPPASVQSQYLDSSSTTHRCNTISSMDTSTSSRANENNNFPPSPHFDSAMMSESSTRVHNRNGANNTPCAGSQEGVEATRSANQYSTMNMIKSEGGAEIAPAPSPRNDPTSTVDDDDDNATSSKNLIVTANTTTTTSVRETAHHCELSETFIASKNDTDQYCTAAAAELITSLHSSSSSSSPCSSSSASALSIQQSSSSYPSSSSLAASHQAHADSVQSAEFDTQPPPPSPLNRIT
ncbi:hypothetical protein Ocin01_07929 [Orchesella cincta]|uniref:Uncharacterized protein n=1 Tax=Orchesella cincta TaxID=48709 RepID=A0A1D2N0L3_ORCCI|nr:hypothetical protein Ocin01_07929 [Orchesella cincta]